MGLFNSFKEKFNSATGLGKNNDLLSVALGPAAMLTSAAEKGKLKDVFLGKKAKDIKPDSIANQIRATQTKGLGELNKTLDTTSGADTVRLQAAQAEKSVLSSAQDARRNAQRSMAQNGLMGSSLGLSSQRTIDQTAGNEVASIKAGIPGQIREAQLQDATTRINAGGINQNGMNFNTIEGQRSGGIMGIAGALAPMVGSLAGGMMGGPAGATAGGAVGGGIGSALAPKPAQQGAYAPSKYSMGNYQF